MAIARCQTPAYRKHTKHLSGHNYVPTNRSLGSKLFGLPISSASAVFCRERVSSLHIQNPQLIHKCCRLFPQFLTETEIIPFKYQYSCRGQKCNVIFDGILDGMIKWWDICFFWAIFEDSGRRNFYTRVRNFVEPKLNAAPRLAWAFEGVSRPLEHRWRWTMRQETQQNYWCKAP